jgi:hypothetical protein
MDVGSVASILEAHVTHSQQTSIKDLYAFLGITVQMGHDHKLSMKLCSTKDKLHHIPLYSSIMQCDCFLMILKYLHFADNQSPSTQNREDPDYDRSRETRKILDILNSKF